MSDTSSPTAYFTIAPGGENGYAFGIIEDFYYPWTPVYKFQVTILPVSSGILTWSPAGWTGNVREAHLPFITPAIEKAFTPAIYRFRININ